VRLISAYDRIILACGCGLNDLLPFAFLGTTVYSGPPHPGKIPIL
jgi:hypothetical protein